jgi:hypothetical protein
VLARADYVDLVVGRVNSSFHFCTFQGKFHTNTGVKSPSWGGQSWLQPPFQGAQKTATPREP